MDRYIIRGGKPLSGQITISGAKNVALKVLVASLLTNDKVVIHNLPLLRDVQFMLEVLHSLGVTYTLDGHTVTLVNSKIRSHEVPLEVGARMRTSSLVIGPLLARTGKAKIPNPGGCRLGARPIDRHIEGLRQMGANIDYRSTDGFFYASTDQLHGTDFTFEKNTHTGTETLILAAVLANGTTIIRNAAEEIEVDELIDVLNSMGAKIERSAKREITIHGVDSLHGTEYTVMSDRNEEVTFAVAAAITNGEIIVDRSVVSTLDSFIDVYTKAGLSYERLDEHKTRYFRRSQIRATDVTTEIHPGFMTDWQAPWAVLMTQAQGISTIHETVFESRFSYVKELQKMGANIEFFHPDVQDPKATYNFNLDDRIDGYKQAIKIHGPTPLHDAIVTIGDLRAGATLALAALVATGESSVHGVEQVERGYERFDERLALLGADIQRLKEEP